MGELVEVREFETIVGKDCGKDYTVVPEERFYELVEFIHAFNFKDEDIHEFIRIGHEKNVGYTVTFKNYVGLIQMKNDYQIQILPKIEFKTQNNTDKTKQIFIKMLRSLKDFPCKTFSNANLNIDRMNLYEIFINMYLQEVRNLVRHGIKSTYTGIEDNLSVYKGKLLIKEHLKYNIADKTRFYVGYDEYHVNRPENKLIKSTLLKLQRITTSAENSKEIRQLLSVFELVDFSTNFDNDFSKVTIDRNTKDYEMLMKWSKVFLKNKSFSTFSGTDSAKALLFPMEKIFESYVAKNVKNIFGNDGWDVSAQDKGHCLFKENNREIFSLRPDLVIRKKENGNEKVVILDTKWKRLVDDRSKNYGISQADMYQMFAYSKKYKTPYIWLLYPYNSKMKEYAVGSDGQIKKKIVFEEEKNDGDICTKVSLFFVDVADIETSLKNLLEQIQN